MERSLNPSELSDREKLALETTYRLLGSLGIVDALADEYDLVSPEHNDSIWLGYD